MPRRARLKPHMTTNTEGRRRVASTVTAEEAKLDCALVEVNCDAYAAFIARLDTPLPPSDRLKRTFQSKAPWK